MVYSGDVLFLYLVVVPKLHVALHGVHSDQSDVVQLAVKVIMNTLVKVGHY